MKNFKNILLATTLLTALTSCEAPIKAVQMDVIAEDYIKLVLQVGEHEAGYIDAYYGPEEWAAEAKAETGSLKELGELADYMLQALPRVDTSGGTDMERARLNFLTKQITAVRARIAMLQGESFTFDEETRLLYDAVSPKGSTDTWDATLAELNALIPGEGDFKDRFAEFRKQFQIPTDKLGAVFEASIAGCRAATQKYVDLPKAESFTFEFVTDKAWSGYNWYQGGANSLIQVNTDFPIYIERAVDLGCHEGYPGHHVFNAMLEDKLVNDLGWKEFSVYPLFSPQSLIAEGTANYGIQMAFPGEERLKFETEVLYPLAGISTANATTYDKALRLMGKMRYNYTDVARAYLDGEITRDEAIDMRAKYGLMARDKAEQSIRFMETYRGYVINYTLGMDLSDGYVIANSDGSAEGRWKAYEYLLSTPMTASGLE